MYDVIVVGAGPSGSYAAYSLAVRGYEVLVVEEHEIVGQPTNCSGLIGAEAFVEYDLPTDAILRSFDSARFISPGGEEALVSADRPQAYVVDRAAFDRGLAERAKAAGAEYKLGVKCLGMTRTNGVIVARIRGANCETSERARVGIVATGVKYGLSRAIGAPCPTRFLNAAQAEVRMEGVEEVEVYFGRQVSPGSFGWAIPLGDERVKIGVCNEGKVRTYMDRLYQNGRIGPRLLNGHGEIKIKTIPISAAKKTVTERILIVGDAAGQVKPTTGGGIHYGIMCGDLAACTLDEAFAAGDLSERRLASYETRWRKQLGRELRVGALFRRSGGWLKDSQIDKLIRSYEDPAFKDLVRNEVAFERHSRFVLALWRSPIFWRALAAPARSWMLGT